MASEDFPPVPGSSVMHISGTSDVAGVVFTAPGVLDSIHAKHDEWARAYKADHGEFPGGEVLIDFMIDLREEEEEAARRRYMMSMSPDLHPDLHPDLPPGFDLDSVPS